MHETLKIKIDFAQERQRPAEVFQAMSCYIEAYQALGQVMVSALGCEEDFTFQLEGVQVASIASLLKAAPGRFKEWVESAVYQSGFSLAEKLSTIQSTATEEEVDALASDLEADLATTDTSQIVDPIIDRKAFAHALNKFSEANKKMEPGETVTTSIAGRQNVTPINTHWRFNANPKDMFRGITTKFNGVDRIYVRAPVNFGKGAWPMLSVISGYRYNAKITDAKWLEDYQAGIVLPIGPKDMMEAEVSFELYTPPPGQGKILISDAKIVKVITVHRNVGLQNETAPLF